MKIRKIILMDSVTLRGLDNSKVCIIDYFNKVSDLNKDRTPAKKSKKRRKGLPQVLFCF